MKPFSKDSLRWNPTRIAQPLALYMFSLICEREDILRISQRAPFRCDREVFGMAVCRLFRMWLVLRVRPGATWSSSRWQPTLPLWPHSLTGSKRQSECCGFMCCWMLVFDGKTSIFLQLSFSLQAVFLYTALKMYHYPLFVFSIVGP